jgi:hypothetical protein
MADSLHSQLLDPTTQSAALSALRKRDDAEAVLIAAAREAKPQALKKLISALQKRGSIDGLHVVLLRYNPKDLYGFFYGGLVIDALAKMGEAGVIPLARYAQEPPSPAGFPQRVLSFRRSVTQMYALKALSKMGPLLKPTLPVLLSLRGIPHGNSRCYLPRAIAAACDDPNILLDCLKHALRSDTDKNVRISTIHALSSYGEAGEAGLLEALSDPEPRARLCVLQYLVLIDKPAIRARLTEASKSDRSKKVRDAARQALCG